MKAWMLELDRTQWRLYAAPDDAAPTVAAAEFSERELAAEAKNVYEALSDHRGEPVVVALCSAWCLNATLTAPRPQELRDRQTMLYRLEESIPWSIEDSVADYLRAGQRALMVAVPAAPLAEFFQQLEEFGVQIQSIAPLALLACAAHLERGEWPAQHVVVFQEHGWIDLLRIEGNRPIDWTAFPAFGTSLGQELGTLALDSGAALPLVGYRLDDEAATEIARTDAVHRIESEQHAIATKSRLALAAAAKIAEGQLEPFIELKRGRFGRTRGHVALRRYAAVLRAAVAILIISASSVLLYRAHAAGREADRLAARQAEVFRSAFPNAKVPVGIKSRLESELEKLKGLRGGDLSLPQETGAIAMLHRMLAAMPTDRRFRLLEIRIEEGRLYLDGEVIGHSDAEAIAQRLRAEGFTAASPRTQRLDERRVSLRITGTLAPPERVAARKVVSP